MKRVFELTKNDSAKMSKKNILKTIKHSESRTLMAETVVSCQPFSEGISNPELATSFGADMLTLNTLDLKNPYIEGLYDIDYTADNLIGMVS